jgi:hypothetical protein
MRFAQSLSGVVLLIVGPSSLAARHLEDRSPRHGSVVEKRAGIGGGCGPAAGTAICDSGLCCSAEVRVRMPFTSATVFVRVADSRCVGRVSAGLVVLFAVDRHASFPTGQVAMGTKFHLVAVPRTPLGHILVTCHTELTSATVLSGEKSP